MARRGLNVPFQDDLTPADDDLFNLGDFQHYHEAPGPKKADDSESTAMSAPAKAESKIAMTLESLVTMKQPLIVRSSLTNPFLNLAIEDYIYSHMPVPGANGNCNRLVFYVNKPCVVIGKNQNPWKEVNLPALTSLRIPLVRRRSGGGTVVHDLGNVNYSFMTTKEKFDRHVFANIVAAAANDALDANDHMTSDHVVVNSRGDIVTADGLKVSGLAYKLLRGKSYHHGTMLLTSRLDVLRALLKRDSKLGIVETKAAVASVPSPVANLGLSADVFIDSVSTGFSDAYGTAAAPDTTSEEYIQNELLGLTDFFAGQHPNSCDSIIIDESTTLPAEILETLRQLATWEWVYGSSTAFTHRFEHPSGIEIEFEIEKGAKLKGVKLSRLKRTESKERDGQTHEESLALETRLQNIREAFECLDLVLERGDIVRYTGSDVAGFITDDELSDWIGNCIDGTT